MGASRRSAPHASSALPHWLVSAPADLRPILDIGYERFGDDPAAIAHWIGQLRDYRVFWSIVEGEDEDVEQRFARDRGLRAQIADARAHPERRVPRPPRRTA